MRFLSVAGTSGSSLFTGISDSSLLLEPDIPVTREDPDVPATERNLIFQ
jgi:hypothetical protein